MPHQRLLLTLKPHGIGDGIIDWIEQWLTDRRQRVVVDGEVSNGNGENRRATNTIPELRDLSYKEHLKECGLTHLETRRLRGDQIEVLRY